MNEIQIMSLISSIIATLCIVIVGYFDYKNKLNVYLRSLARGESGRRGVEFEYWIYLILFCAVICINSVVFRFSIQEPCNCPSEREIIIEYLQEQTKLVNKK